MRTTQVVAAGILFLLVIPGTLWFIGVTIDGYLFPPKLLGNLSLIGAPVLITGIITSLASIWQLQSKGSGLPWGDISPESQSSRLVTGGLYRYTRNPMLFGFGVFILGAGLFVGSPTMAFALSTICVGLVSIWIKKLEEPKLVERFGEEYVEYREKTSFLIPWTPKR